MKWRVGILGIVFVVLSLVFVGVVSAGGPYWVVNETPLYLSNARVFPALDAEGKAVIVKAGTVVTTTILVEDWAKLDAPYEDLWIHGSNLSATETEAVQAERVENTLVGDLSWGQFMELLQKYFAGQLVLPSAPAAQVPVPAAASPAPAAPVVQHTHIVVAGESLSSIALKYGIAWQDLAKANGIVSPWTIEVGQKLTIPSGGTTIAAAPAVSAVVDPTPLHAVKLTQGQTVIPSWGYGPWGVGGIAYPKVSPSGSLPKGASQLVTDFTGRNWLPEGNWTYTVPSGVTEIWVTIQGDAPASVSWVGSTLTLRTNAEITSKAKPALDNAPMPTTGSTGISAAVYVK